MNLKKILSPFYHFVILYLRNGRYLIGDYVFNNLIEKGFINVVYEFDARHIANQSD